MSVKRITPEEFDMILMEIVEEASGKDLFVIGYEEFADHYANAVHEIWEERNSE